ncbi:MAG: aldo/keto reductase [Candidatus Odinarchaeota archaeon]|nr:aldo/keto reductase [Candidatus Odinarchaeota archaeon]
MTPDYSQDDLAIKALRHGISLGMWLIDTAEVYGGGHAEELVGEAIKIFNREEVFIVTKVWETNLRYDDVLKAAKGSLKRLKTNYIDLYLIHWPNPRIPLSETMKAMEKLVSDRLVRYIGVSNFSVELMEEARSYLSKEDIVANQVKYNVYDRSVERDILPYCQKEGITLMAYTPLAKGNVSTDKTLIEIGKKYGKTATQVALNWLISKDMVIAIPKAIRIEHIEENAGAMGWRLSEEDIRYIEQRI